MAEGTLQQRQTSPRGFSASASLEGGPFSAGQFMDEASWAPGAGGQLDGLNDLMGLLKRKGNLGLDQQQWMFDEMRRRAAAERNQESVNKPRQQYLPTYTKMSPFYGGSTGWLEASGGEPGAVASGYMTPQQMAARQASRPNNAQLIETSTGLPTSTGDTYNRRVLSAMQPDTRADWSGMGTAPRPDNPGPGNPTDEFNAWKQKILMSNLGATSGIGGGG